MKTNCRSKLMKGNLQSETLNNSNLFHSFLFHNLQKPKEHRANKIAAANEYQIVCFANQD
jgi:predicted secreted acid phosphatase